MAFSTQKHAALLLRAERLVSESAHTLKHWDRLREESRASVERTQRHIDELLKNERQPDK